MNDSAKIHASAAPTSPRRIDAGAVLLRRSPPSLLRVTVSLAGLAAAVLIVKPAASHVIISSHTTRHGEDEIKFGPCGSRRSERGAVIHVFEPGETIHLQWNEFVFHPGYFRISFDEDGVDDFVDPANYNDFYTNAAVLVDNLFPHQPPFNEDLYEFDLMLPDVQCENCTIQLIQMMTDKPPYEVGTNDIYYNCLDVMLTSGPQPGPSLREGDFNGDKLLTTEDIELLFQAMRTNGLDSFDLTHDGLVDVKDLVFWVADIKQTWIGDANLDGQFNSIDLVDVLRAAQFEDNITGNSTWGTGDWTGDAEFDRRDLILALQHGGYEAGTRLALSPVPEPTSSMLALTAALIGIAIRWRRAGDESRFLQ